jgi:hypothetical protein
MMGIEGIQRLCCRLIDALAVTHIRFSPISELGTAVFIRTAAYFERGSCATVVHPQ